MDSDCPFKIELRMEDGPGISYLLTNISDTVQEYINDWPHGMAPVLAIMDESGAELEFEYVFPPIEPVMIAGCSKLQPGAVYRGDTEQFLLQVGTLFYRSEETKSHLQQERQPEPPGYEFSEPFAGYIVGEWSYSRMYRLLPGRYKAQCGRSFSDAWKTLEDDLLPPVT